MARYSDTIDDQYGRPIGGALVYVTDSTTRALAILSADDSSALPNPVTTTESGALVFNVIAGFYDIAYWFGGRMVREDFGVNIGGASSLPAGSVANSLGTSTTVAPSQYAVSMLVINASGTATDRAPSQAAVSAVVSSVAATAALALWSDIYASPTVVFGSTDQAASIEGGSPNIQVTRNNDLAFVQISATARDKTVPSGGSFTPLDTLRVTGLPFSANGIVPQQLFLSGSGLPPGAIAELVGDTIGFYSADGVALAASDIADTYYFRIGGVVAVLPEMTT